MVANLGVDMRFFLPLLIVTVAFAQVDQGRLAGTVVDTSGGVIAKAEIKVQNERTGVERKAVSDDQGMYIVTNLAASQYTVTATVGGLAPTKYTEVNLSVGQERLLNIVMQPPTVTSEVTVSGGELTTVDTSSASIGANVNAREVGNIPVNGRQLSQLYLMTPGSTTAGGGSYDNIRFNGRSNQSNEIRYDGVEGSSVVDQSPGNLSGEVSTGFRLQSSLENVQEFRVESNNYPAEFGTGTGGQISVVTKSGGNDFHGSMFEYLRNDQLDARNFFAGAKTPLRLNQYGWSVGGPVKRDKLFFFSSMEVLNQRAGVSLIATVPSASARARAVSSIKPLLDAFPAGQIPSSNPDLDFVRKDGSSAIDEYYGGIRLDYILSPKYTLTMRYFRDQGTFDSPLDVSGSIQHIYANPQNGLISLQQSLTPAILNETKFGYNGAKTRINGVAPSVNGIDISAISVSISGTTVLPGSGSASAGTSTLGGLIRSNSSQNGRAQPYTNYTMSFIDNLSILKGSHSMKFGMEIRPVRIYTDRLGATTYTYSLATLLTNTPSSVAILGDVSAPNPLHGGATGNRFLKQAYYIGYGQDEWRIRPNLTVNYGLRWEYYSVMHEDRDLYTLFIAGKGLTTGPWYNSKKTNFGPRLAFTWSPTALKNKTVVRVGSGLYYGPGQPEDTVQPIDSDRVSVTLTNAVFPVDSRAIIAAVNPANLTNFQPRAYTPGYTVPEKILSYTASIQQSLPGSAVLTVAYVGSQGRNLFVRTWANGITGVTQNATTGAGTAVLEMSPKFAQVDVKSSGGTDHYNALQSQVQRRFSKGLTIGGQYTWSHSIGNASGGAPGEGQTAQNPFDFNALDKGNNANDVRHGVNVTALYELPFGRDRQFLRSANGFVDGVLGGWQLGGVLNARTGLPIDVTIDRPDLAYRVNSTGQYVQAPLLAGSDVLTTAVINNPYGGAFRSNRRPDVVAGVDPYLHTGDRKYMINPAAFSIPTPGQYGNLARAALIGPGLSQFDLTVDKRFRITERVNVAFRGEFYNLFNRANFAPPPIRLSNALGTGSNQLQPGQPYSLSAAGGTFGIGNATVTKDVGLGAARQIQWSLRVNF